jgi:anti-sigma factor RsiW
MVTLPSVTKEDLIRYVDGRLAPERSAQVAAYLHEHPETAGELQAQQRLNALLLARYKHICEEAIPPALLQAAAKGPRPRTRLRRETLRAVAVAAVAAILGGAAGWLWRSAMIEPQWQDFTKQAAAAYRVYTPERDRPVEIAARHELLAWLSRRLGMPIVAPRLDAFGYHFIGGRLLPTAGGTPAAQLMYENAEKRRFTLYIRADLRNSRDVEFQFARQDDVNVLYWLDGPRGYAMSANLDESAMLPIAKVVYDELRR